MIVLPLASTTVAPLGMLTLPAGPTATIRSPSITIVPLSMAPASSPAMVRMRAPVSATVPLGLSARRVRAIEMPLSGGVKPGAPSACGARGNIAAAVAR